MLCWNSGAAIFLRDFGRIPKTQRPRNHTDLWHFPLTGVLEKTSARVRLFLLYERY